MRTIFTTAVRIDGGDASRLVTADNDHLAPIEILDPKNDERLVMTLRESRALRKALKRAERAAREHASA